MVFDVGFQREEKSQRLIKRLCAAASMDANPVFEPSQHSIEHRRGYISHSSKPTPFFVKLHNMFLSLIISAVCWFATASLGLPAPKADFLSSLTLREAETALAIRNVGTVEKRQDTYSMPTPSSLCDAMYSMPTTNSLTPSLAITGIADAAQQKTVGIVLNNGLTEATFTQDLVVALVEYYTTKNAIVYHNTESYHAFSDDAVHIHYDLPIFAATFGYEIYVFDTGT